METINTRLTLHQLFIPLMGILPIVVAVTSVNTGLFLGIVFMIVFASSSLVIFIIRKIFPLHLQLPVIIVISTTIVTLAIQFSRLWQFGLSIETGLYLPLMAMNAFLLAGIQQYINPHNLKKAGVNIVIITASVFLICLLTGFLREFSGLVILNESAGIFLLLALLLAGYNVIMSVKNSG